MAIPTMEEPAEAVIISGPRKGEFIAVSSSNEEAIPPEAEALLGEMIGIANRITETLQAMRRDGEAFQDEMRERKKERDELLRSLGRTDQVAV